MPDYRRSPSLRLIWAATTLITVWCLGCTAFDPLLAQFGGSATMACASVSSEQQPLGAAVSGISADMSASAVTAAPSAAATDIGCSCQSCHAAQSMPHEQRIVTQPTPRIDGPQPASPATVTRSPLLPPPERVA